MVQGEAEKRNVGVWSKGVDAIQLRGIPAARACAARHAKQNSSTVSTSRWISAPKFYLTRDNRVSSSYNGIAAGSGMSSSRPNNQERELEIIVAGTTNQKVAAAEGYFCARKKRGILGCGTRIQIPSTA